MSLEPALSTEAKSWQKPDVRPQLTSLQERCTQAHRHYPEGPLLRVTGVWFPFLVPVALWWSAVTLKEDKEMSGLQ